MTEKLVAGMKHVIFNLTTNLTDEKCSLFEDWDLVILSVDWGKKQFSPEKGAQVFGKGEPCLNLSSPPSI